MVMPRLTRAMVCDLVVWIVPLVLAYPLRGWLDTGLAGFGADDDERSALLGWIVALAMIGYAVGCWLKRPGLQSRISVGDSTGCLLVAWFPVMISLTILGATIVAVELDAEPDSTLNMLTLIAAATAPVAFGIRAMAASGPPRFGAWRSHPITEVVADVVLVASILPAAIVWQDSVSGLFLQNLDGYGFGTRVFAAVLTTGSFALFYFAPRLPLVIDRLRDRASWITFGLVLTPVLWRCFV